MEKNRKTVVKLKSLENFTECTVSLLQYFKGAEEGAIRGVWLTSVDGKNSFRVQIISLTVTDEIELLDENKGQLKFSGQLLEHKPTPNGEGYAGTLFTSSPILTGYLSIGYGSRETYLETDRELHLQCK